AASLPTFRRGPSIRCRAHRSARRQANSRRRQSHRTPRARSAAPSARHRRRAGEAAWPPPKPHPTSCPFCQSRYVSKKEGAAMDLGLKNKKAVVCASSKGLGFACAAALAAAGVTVVMNGRDAKALDEAVARVRKAGGDVTPVVADLNEPEGRA